jgi:hypothetical protein
VICARHKTEYREVCAGCLNQETDDLVARLLDTDWGGTAAEARALSLPALRTTVARYEHEIRKRWDR